MNDQNAVPQTTMPKKKSKLGLIIGAVVGILVLLGAVAFMLVYFLVIEPASTAKAYLESSKESYTGYSKAYNKLKKDVEDVKSLDFSSTSSFSTVVSAGYQKDIDDFLKEIEKVETPSEKRNSIIESTKNAYENYVNGGKQDAKNLSALLKYVDIFYKANEEVSKINIFGSSTTTLTAAQRDSILNEYQRIYDKAKADMQKLSEDTKSKDITTIVDASVKYIDQTLPLVKKVLDSFVSLSSSNNYDDYLKVIQDLTKDATKYVDELESSTSDSLKRIIGFIDSKGTTVDAEKEFKNAFKEASEKVSGPKL